jgi:hypothetical protein
MRWRGEHGDRVTTRHVDVRPVAAPPPRLPVTVRSHDGKPLTPTASR